MDMQLSSIRSPSSGEPLSETVHSAAWMKALVQAATGRTTIGGDTQNSPPPSVRLLTPVVSSAKIAVPAYSLIGAKGATYPGSPTIEPTPYMQATLDVSDFLYYTICDYPAAVDYIEGFLFQPGVYTRVRCNTPGADTYTPGMCVGRKENGTVAIVNKPGLILVTKPYTADGGTSYYCWVVEDRRTEYAVILDAALAVATNSKTGPTSCLATICGWNATLNDYVESTTQITVWNHSESTAHAINTFGIARKIDGHFIFFGDCNAMASR